jgi:hypothetical protein
MIIIKFNPIEITKSVTSTSDKDNISGCIVFDIEFMNIISNDIVLFTIVLYSVLFLINFKTACS